MDREYYQSVNHPEIFEFHDAWLKLDYTNEEEIAVFVENLNIREEAEQDPKGYDLEIKKAHILFHGVSEFSYNPGQTWIMDEQGNSVPVGSEIIYHGQEALERFTEDLRVGAHVFSHTIVDEDFYEIYGEGNEPFFLIRFKAQKCVVAWDEYKGPAWYVSRRWLKGSLTLNAPKGEITTEAQFWIDYDPDELYMEDEVDDVDPQKISVAIKYEGKDYWGRGKDCSGQEAMADLQNQLPDDVVLKCCLSCRHGNCSPFSNAFDLIYCMKDMVIKNKMDLCDYTTDAGEENKRRRHYTDLCEDWKEQRDDIYVYSDYPLYLKKDRE